jgi:phosphatidylinositol-4,5-bisphosphate 3-kinase
MDTMLKIKFNSATYVNVREKGEVSPSFTSQLAYQPSLQIYIKTGIYHGTESLCPIQDSVKVVSSNPKWNQWMEYDLYLPDIPRCARLCIALCCVSKKQKKKVSCVVRTCG